MIGRFRRFGRANAVRRAVLGVAAMLLAGASASGETLDIDRLVERQGQVSRALIEVAADMESSTAAEQKVRAVLYGLATTETTQAVKALQALRGEKNPAKAREKVEALAQAQDRTLEMIKRILGIMDQLEAQTKEEAKPERGSDLDSDAQEALDKLKNEMEEFAEEHRKILSGTHSLAKQHVEDFTPEEEETLKQLEANQAKWEKFLQEKYSDLSKIQVQDFSNSVMLDEIVEIYSEVKMAQDALSQRAVEIATPVESAGLEGATSIETNIEKWLPDTPDRTRWQMEEPLMDYQTPMAELPQELEDLVGDLMEEEEDLMSDVEDATSAWNDSLDKGVGWDAMDGPISSMSAKGVTGNRLPNSSEISGRSGEGRTGKAAGEFVENTAMGKGGRRTPTRLTPDPFEKGVVDDQSADSGGGATGGGKISGGGEEGLEGPPPPELQQEMNALAGKQAELRNRAERVAAGFQVMNYPSESVERVVRQMEAIEGDLKSGRYTNIARRRDVLLKGFKDTLSIAKGEARVQRDFSRVGARLEDEIVEGSGEQTPRGYEDLVDAYYRALSAPE